MKAKFSPVSAITGGIAATAAMTLFTYMAPLMGFEMNIPKMLAGTMHLSIFFGWTVHFMIGTILAINYGAIFLNRLNKLSNWKTGAIYGIIPWIAAQIMVMPMMSLMNGSSYLNGFFSGSLLTAMASLIGHLLYGAVLGSIYKPQVEKKEAIA